VQTTGSPMTAAQMARASDADILGLFDELVDATGWDHPRDRMRGGSVLASREFGEFAKADPQRALRLIDSLSPTQHERPVGHALASLAEAQALSPTDMVALIHRLDGRSFASSEFRHWAADCLGKLAERLAGLDDRTCALLESWLADAEGLASAVQAEPEESDQRRSILWQDGGFQVRPGGNYPILHALALGLLLREPMAADAWLGVLERHLATRREEPEAWRALAHELRFLANAADRGAAVGFIERLLRTVEGLADSEDGVALLALTHRWLPPEMTHACLDRWRAGSWPRGPQAAGELALLRHILAPADDVAAALCRAVVSGGPDATASLAGLRLGMAHSAAGLWRNDRLRPAVTPVWAALAAVADAETAAALMDVFRQAGPLPVDGCMRRVLTATLEGPALLEVDPMFLVEQLKHGLREGLEPGLVASVARALAERKGAELGDVRTAWAGSVGDLVEISLTLQRLPEGREDGTALFERLMEIGAHEVDQTLCALDRRTLH
jgi:hypothetical protein